MISPQLVARIERAFPAPLRERFVEALRDGYETACEKWTPERGSIPLTYGIDVWASVTHELKRLGGDAGLDLDVEQHMNRTTLCIDGLHLSFYRVGQYADEDIRTCFPNNRHAAPRLAKNNLQLDIFLSGHPDPDAAVDLVLAHLGNPATGLEAAYLCVPTAADDERLSEWGYHELIWRRDGVTAAAPVTSPAPVPVPAVVIEQPMLRLRTRGEAASE